MILKKRISVKQKLVALKEKFHINIWPPHEEKVFEIWARPRVVSYGFTGRTKAEVIKRAYAELIEQKEEKL